MLIFRANDPCMLEFVLCSISTINHEATTTEANPSIHSLLSIQTVAKQQPSRPMPSSHPQNRGCLQRGMPSPPTSSPLCTEHVTQLLGETFLCLSLFSAMSWSDVLRLEAQGTTSKGGPCLREHRLLCKQYSEASLIPRMGVREVRTK